MRTNRILLLFAIFLSITVVSYAQKAEKGNSGDFFFDATVFRANDSSTDARVDVYTVVPFKTLRFEKSGDVFGAAYQINIKVLDSSDTKVQEKVIKRKFAENDFFLTQGGTGKFDPAQISFILPKGKYKIEAAFSDYYSKLELTRSRNILIIDFASYDISLSGILLVSSIEETAGRSMITPHISDNIGQLADGFFAFFEVYNKKYDSIDFCYTIKTEDGKSLFRSGRIRKKIDTGSNRTYLRITKPNELASGNYMLDIAALSPSVAKDYSESDYLAIAQRTIKVYRTISGYTINDLDLSVRQLRFATESADIDYINAADNPAEKLKRFEMFWKKLDPTPNTERNEAFDEYYGRIEFANKNFRSYTDGWLTDRGSVYIVYGSPSNIERYSNYGDGRTAEKWTYANVREFIFVDNSGFGDYRLVQPYSVMDKYQYRR